jgi:two-component system, cell cycle sensor histidine kinase and response regulator CckA
MVRHGDAQFSKLFWLTPDSVSISRFPDGCILDVNEGFCRVTGYCREDVIGRSTTEVGLWSEPAERMTMVAALDSEGGFSGFEAHIRKKDGEIIHGEISGRLMEISGEQLVLAVARDITQRHRMEEALRRSEMRFAEIFRITPDAVAVTRIADGRYLDVNEAFSRATGYTREEVVGHTALELGIWVDPMERAEVVQKVQATHGFSEHLIHIRRKDGREILALMSGCILETQGQAQMITVSRDITEEWNTRHALQESEEKFRRLVQYAVDGILLGDVEGRITLANPRACEMTGLSFEEMQGKPIAKIFPPSVLNRVPLRYDLLKEGKTVLSQRDLQRKDGSHLPIEMSSKMMPDGTYQTFIRDITERRVAEEALRDSESRFRALYENTIDSIFWIKIESADSFIIESINPAQEKALGMRNEDVAGKHLSEFLPEEFAQALEANYRRCLQAGHPIHYEETAPLRGENRVFETLLVPIRDGKGHIFRIVGNSREITEARRAEEALRQAQKLESLGILAGGIAHDFNNLLSAMLGNLNLAQLRCAPESPAQPYLENVENILLRAADLTKQMLAYSGKGRFVVLPHDLNRVVREMTHLLNVSISKKIALHYELAGDLPLIEADAAQIQQVVMNLVTNASEAIGEESGVVRIATRQEELGADQIATGFAGQALNPGLHAVLEVIDPFFTTKRSGRGLGLSAMLGILRGHGGGIHIESQPGRGTCFSLYFPARLGALPPDAERDVTRVGEALHGRVLLVDDEPVVRDSTAQMLEILGLEVIQAVDGLDAVNRFEGLKGTVNLVIMDLSMPRMDGREAFVQLRRMQPDLPIILCSGFSEGESLQEALEGGLSGFIQKPFLLSDLKKAVRKIL